MQTDFATANYASIIGRNLWQKCIRFELFSMEIIAFGAEYGF